MRSDHAEADVTPSVRVVTYARDCDQRTLGVQSALLRQYVRDHDGWELVGELSDCEARQSLRRALCEARTGAYDFLLVHSLTRLSRSIVEMSRILRLLESSDMTVRSVAEPVDLRWPSGRLLTQFLAAMAEYERESHRARTAAHKRARTRRCR